MGGFIYLFSINALYWPGSQMATFSKMANAFKFWETELAKVIRKIKDTYKQIII